MRLVKTQSKRLNERQVPYTDYYLEWEYDNKKYSVRVAPCFTRDYKFLFALAESIQTANK